MIAYFKQFGERYLGRPKTTLPILLNKELSTAHPNLSLSSENDLEHLRNLAQDRKKWNKLKRKIVIVAEASSSSPEEPDAEGP